MQAICTVKSELVAKRRELLQAPRLEGCFHVSALNLRHEIEELIEDLLDVLFGLTLLDAHLCGLLLRALLLQLLAGHRLDFCLKLFDLFKLRFLVVCEICGCATALSKAALLLLVTRRTILGGLARLLAHCHNCGLVHHGRGLGYDLLGLDRRDHDAARLDERGIEFAVVRRRRNRCLRCAARLMGVGGEEVLFLRGGAVLGH